MNVQRLRLAEGARRARGTAVIIDVFRAFTCEPLIYALGARRIVLEADVARCLTYRGEAVLVGEVDERPIDGFDLTNSPFLIASAGRERFHERTVIHRTTSGVTGALTALDHAEEVLLASYVTANAIARYLHGRRPELVSIVAMGSRSVPTPEDERCGDYIESLLTGRSYDHISALNEILRNESAQRFLKGDKTHLPKEDLIFCLQRDLFDFVLKAARKGDVVVAERHR